MAPAAPNRRRLLKTLLALPFGLAARAFSSGPTAASARAVEPRLSDEEIARQCLDALWNRGDDSLFRMHGLDPQGIRPDAFLEKHIGQPANMGRKRQAYRNAFPDLKFDFLGTSRSGSVVTVRWTAQGTHRGELGDLKPKGRRCSITGQWNVTFANGRISTFTCAWDHAGLERQIA